MTPEERAKLKPFVRPKLSDAERALLPRVNIPPKPVNAPHKASLFAKHEDSRKYVETLEQNQKLNLCCRHVEDEGHMAQWFATPTASRTEKGNIVPDILIITCGGCGRNHYRFCVGNGDVRHVMEVR